MKIIIDVDMRNLYDITLLLQELINEDLIKSFAQFKEVGQIKEYALDEKNLSKKKKI